MDTNCLTYEIYKNQCRLENLNEILKLLDECVVNVHLAFNRMEKTEENLVEAIKKVKLTRSNIAQETKDLLNEVKYSGYRSSR
jgi:hypothetical protein